MDSDTTTRDRLCDGLCLPIAPIAATEGQFDPLRQRLLWRYYATAGTGGAVADLTSGSPQLRRELLASLLAMPNKNNHEPWLRIALVGESEALSMASELRAAGADAIAVALDEATGGSTEDLIGLLQAVGRSAPLIVYPQAIPSRRLSTVQAWRRVLEIPQLSAVSLPSQRQAAVMIVRAMMETRRKDICIYTANEINPVIDLVTPFRYANGNKTIERRVVGGMLRLWGVFTARAVELLERCHVVAQRGAIPDELLQVSVEVSELSMALATENNAGFREVLSRNKIFADNRDAEGKPPSPATLDRVATALDYHQHLTDFAYVAARLEKWMAD
ncbi:hypothetical protein LOC68_20080 [Blastopirellula sp. JC732]|uniref:Uncharacterized protein n=1 Tax=Blastopirellula sediminis TaxID=2894196 RepID=A0A9X1SH09_9BACT|nr:hypothetical protein [Blastopirellula sediminis]MCC9606001.1 hypothetical protein [Blastopirellula sediminis]MCC9630700.1 hypothetical protein [Blastopirellula sediminis]